MSIFNRRIVKFVLGFTVFFIMVNVVLVRAQTTTTTTGTATPSGTAGLSGTAAATGGASSTASTTGTASDPCAGVTNAVQKYLCYIQLYTYGTLTAVNNLPTYISNWIDPDTSDATLQLQGSLSSINTDVITNLTSQSKLQSQLLNDFMNPPSTSITQYANDLSYQTLLGQLAVNPDPRANQSPAPDPAYNYIRNASGMNVLPTAPSTTWSGSNAYKMAYANYYAAVSSSATFNNYIMSQLYADNKNGNQLSKDQQTLLNLVTNGQFTSGSTKANWLATVAVEDIGIVLRQILMFDSESYVLLTQILQTQKQILTAQVMTNTMTMLAAKQYEDTAVKKATGVIR